MRQQPLHQQPLWPDPAKPATKQPRHTGDVEQRRLLVNGHLIEYALCRAKRRTIGLSINGRGLRVGAPLRATLSSIEAMMHKHAEWIIEKTNQWHTSSIRNPESVRDGLTLPILGTPVVIRLIQGKNQFRWDATLSILILEARNDDDAASLLERALRKLARDSFASRITSACTQFSLPQPRLKLSSARTRWGSCSRKGGISLNWRLIHAHSELIDYVIAHELAHLKEMNHGPRFWAEVDRLYPDHVNARKALRSFGDTMPHFA